MFVRDVALASTSSPSSTTPITSSTSTTPTSTQAVSSAASSTVTSGLSPTAIKAIVAVLAVFALLVLGYSIYKGVQWMQWKREQTRGKSNNSGSAQHMAQAGPRSISYLDLENGVLRTQQPNKATVLPPAPLSPDTNVGWVPQIKPWMPQAQAQA